MNELTTVRAANNAEVYRASTDAATLCKEIVVATSSNIQGRRYVSVEGWQAIARAHGCAAGARDVEDVEGGVRAVGEVRDILTGTVVATAEGFVGHDEPTWYGGDNGRGRTLPKRADYAIRAMAQTRAMSRACRSAFAHVVVMMNAGLQTTPAEEVPQEGFDAETEEVVEVSAGPTPRKKLDGPHTSKTALQKAIHGIMNSVRKADSGEAISEMLKKPANKDTIAQAERDWPELITGDPKIEGDGGLKGYVQRRRNELAGSTEFQFLASILAECESSKDLQALINKHGSAIDMLEDAERRKFEATYEEREAAIIAMANVGAG